MSIEVREVTKQFGQFAAISDVSLRIAAGELVALLGPSGSGKTTLLRVIAGLEVPDHGTILLDDEDATEHSARDRSVGFVFQHYALFRHMTTFENVAFGLRVRPRRYRLPEAAIRGRVNRLLELVQIEMLAGRYPSQLSGGQRQRVALARALAVEPRVLLLDEPFGALDAKVRKELRRWLRGLHDELQVTSVFVTHDQEEALELADRVVIMNHGRIEQVGSPAEVYAQPQSPFVYDFLGEVNLFHGRIEGRRLHVAPDFSVELPAETSEPARPAAMYVRPHRVAVDRRPNGHSAFPATVVHVNAAGPLVRLELRARWGDLVKVEITPERYKELAIEQDANVYVSFVSDDVFVAPAEWDVPAKDSDGRITGSDLVDQEP
jgi:sulfate transport system ATP-binding protein